MLRHSKESTVVRLLCGAEVEMVKPTVREAAKVVATVVFAPPSTILLPLQSKGVKSHCRVPGFTRGSLSHPTALEEAVAHPQDHISSLPLLPAPTDTFASSTKPTPSAAASKVAVRVRLGRRESDATQDWAPLLKVACTLSKSCAQSAAVGVRKPINKPPKMEPSSARWVMGRSPVSTSPPL